MMGVEKARGLCPLDPRWGQLAPDPATWSVCKEGGRTYRHQGLVAPPPYTPTKLMVLRPPALVGVQGAKPTGLFPPP